MRPEQCPDCDRYLTNNQCGCGFIYRDNTVEYKSTSVNKGSGIPGYYQHMTKEQIEAHEERKRYAPKKENGATPEEIHEYWLTQIAIANPYMANHIRGLINARANR